MGDRVLPPLLLIECLATAPNPTPKEAERMRKWVPVIAWAVAGGVFAFYRSGSTVTIIAGTALGALIGLAFMWTLSRYRQPKGG